MRGEVAAMQRYRDAVVLVTGAGRGLGETAARRFAAEGARLVLCDRDAEALQGVQASLRGAGTAVEILAGDVAEEATARDLVALALSAFGRLDVAVNNAGVSHALRKLVDLTGDDLQRMLGVNVFGVFYGLKYQIPAMERQWSEAGRFGTILNVASAAGLVGAPLLSAYAASKHAVVGLTRTAAAETARRGVRINAICPSFTETRMVTEFAHEMRGGAEEAVSRMVAAVPMRRLASPDEIVQAMLWICSPENSFMTGHALSVDGGLTAV
ncbi:MAG TPA: SDR family NAD(P)-dependent oxidoreductase [Microvirga sp.]|jgi:NAD(P)-dependent dehydrogenase (short-subunit alcohol dehydrogenase family)|nr:SDR family NAD(P)-dependent oxidoreductase [Microvirga sp.]